MREVRWEWKGEGREDENEVEVKLPCCQGFPPFLSLSGGLPWPETGTTSDPHLPMLSLSHMSTSLHSHLATPAAHPARRSPVSSGQQPIAAPHRPNQPNRQGTETRRQIRA